MKRVWLIVISVLWVIGLMVYGLTACGNKHRPIINQANPTPIQNSSVIINPASPTPPQVASSPIPTKEPIIGLPPTPALTAAGEKLIIEFEVDQPFKDSYPEAPDCLKSGITVGIGYDCHYNAPYIIKSDWIKLGDNKPDRLAATNPYYGCGAKDHLKDVKDILIKWDIAHEVFSKVDVAREFAKAKAAYPGFDKLSLNCQAALISNGFNRGYGFVGPNRDELRDIRDYGVPNQDYKRIADNLRKSSRVWKGTEIERGLSRRRYAEAKLAETPDS